MTTIEDLYSVPEVLEQILDLLPRNELLPVTEVKLFNDVLESSPKLMKRLVLLKYNEGAVVRNYRNLHVVANHEYSLEFISSNSDCLRSIRFSYLEMPTSYLKTILTTTSSTLETLRIIGVKFSADCKVEPIDLTRLKSLTIAVEDVVLPFFEKCQLRHLNITRPSRMNKSVLKKFLESQTDLRKFMVNDAAFLKADILKKVKFQLEEFCINFKDYGMAINKTMIRKSCNDFLWSQKQLEILELVEATCDEKLLLTLEGSRVHKLHLKNPQLKIITEEILVPSVRHLVITQVNEEFNGDLRHFLGCFPNAKKTIQN